MKVVCVGDCGVDRYLPSGDEYFGGITANFARHAKRQFHDDDHITIISAVGDDSGAELVLSSLRDSGIECRISRLVGATPVQFIEIKPDGEKSFVRYEEGVLREFQFDDDDKKIIAECDLLVAPVYLQIVGLFDELMAISTTAITAIDFADFVQHPNFDLLERHIDSIDVGFFGLSVDDTGTIERVAELARRHRKLLVVTLGADGSRAYSGEGQVDCAAVAVDRVVDTTGAGDAYAAAFLGRYCHGSGIEGAMLAGAELAAEVIQRPGTM